MVNYKKNDAAGQTADLLMQHVKQNGRLLAEFANTTDWPPEMQDRLRQLLSFSGTAAKELKRMDRHLASIKSYFHSIVNNSSDIVFTTDLNGRFTSVNPAFLRVFGGTAEGWAGKSAIDAATKDRKKIIRKFRRTLSGTAVETDIRIDPQNAGRKMLQLHMIPITIRDSVREVFVLARDITEQRNMEEKMEYLAFYDQNTGLPNRAKFDLILRSAVEDAVQDGKFVTVMFLGIDRFKFINDTLGHYAGDVILKELGHRIDSALPDNTFLGRFGSDKFVIMLRDEEDRRKIEELGRKLQEKIQQPFIFDGKEYFVTGSIGTSMLPFDGTDHAELMKNADAALNQAKTLGGNQLFFYARHMNRESINRIEMERSIRRALEQEEFYLAYQPIVRLGTERPAGCEALLRWEHPSYGIISPAEFIPVAEETGLINPLGRWVLKTACRQAKLWQAEGTGQFAVSVNVSACQFQNKRFIEDVKNALAYSGLEAEFLHLELTESVMLNHTLDTIQTMKWLRDLGVKISIDDFGTGYSSLSYLRHLPIDTLKIDRSFIEHIHPGSPDYAIVAAIMTMGHGLGLEVIAEGVEESGQYQILRNLGSDYAQGFGIAKPMKAELFSEWASRRDMQMFDAKD